MELDVRALVSAMEAQDVETAAAIVKRLNSAAAAKEERDALKALRRARDGVGTPLVTLAIRLNQPAVLDALLDWGCACQDKQPEEDEGEDESEDAEDDVYYGCSPLCEAIQLGHDDCARVLVAHGASVDAPSRAAGTDATPIHMGALYSWKSAFFREEALATSLALDARDVADYTPLQLAVVHTVFDAARRLLAAGADARAAVPNSATLLHVATTNTLTQIATWLLDDCVVDVDARDLRGNTPLLEATFMGQYRMEHVVYWDSPEKYVSFIQLLLDHGADTEAANLDGNTALFGAVWNGFTDAILLLLARGASVRTTNHHGETVLHVAARSRALLPTTAWEALLRAGADADACDGDGRTFQEIWISRDKDPEKLEEIRVLVERMRPVE